jgi:hypothetical protein
MAPGPGGALLFDVLRGCARVHGGETYSRLAQLGITEIQMGADQSCRRREVIALLGFRENEWNVVTLIAPGIHVNRGVEHAESGMKHDPVLRYRLRKSKTWSEIVRIRILQASGYPFCPPMKTEGTPSWMRLVFV